MTDLVLPRPPDPDDDWRTKEPRLLREAAAPFWGHHPPLPFPHSEAGCPVCQELIARLAAWEADSERQETHAQAAALRGDPEPPATGPDLDEWMETEERLSFHRQLHRDLDKGLPSGELLPPFLYPEWDTADGRPLLREPGAYGVTLQSKAFFVLQRHRLGAFTLATMRDFTNKQEEGPKPAPLRLFDEHGRGIELSGCTSGYGGEGPHGTLWVLRIAGFPERVPPGPQHPQGRNTDLENLVFGHRAFQLRMPTRS
jgi:hypothetical protein